MPEKIYEPEVIPDQPFPGEEETGAAGDGGTGDTYTPSTIPEKVIAKTRVARQVISESLDTLSRRIIGAFTFAETGAIQIGKHEQGESGDIRISPNGIVARDQSGEETVAIDGSTGNATFKGTIKTGSLIAGDDTVVIDEIEGHGRLLFYEEDKVAILLGWGEVG